MWDRDWDQMEICDSMIEGSGKGIWQYRNWDGQINFDGNMGEIYALKNRNTGVWHGSRIRGGNEGVGKCDAEIINI